MSIGPGRREIMTDHKVGTREEWLAERLELLKAEKELTRRNCGRGCRGFDSASGYNDKWSFLKAHQIT